MFIDVASADCYVLLFVEYLSEPAKSTKTIELIFSFEEFFKHNVRIKCDLLDVLFFSVFDVTLDKMALLMILRAPSLDSKTFSLQIYFMTSICICLI